MKTSKKLFLYSRHLIKKHLSSCPYPRIEHPPFSVFSCPEGIKLFQQNTELTVKSGFNLSWSCPEEADSKGFQDTSSWLISLTEWDFHQLLLQKQNPRNPDQKVEFHLRILSENLLLYTLRPSFTPSGFFKTSVLLNPAYKQWFNEAEDAPFPAFKGWITLSPSGLPSPSIGASSLLAETGLPPLLLHQHKSRSYAENSDASTRARVLCAESLSSTRCLRGYLRLFPDQKQFREWKYSRRNRSIRQQKLLN